MPVSAGLRGRLFGFEYGGSNGRKSKGRKKIRRCCKNKGRVKSKQFNK